MIFPTHENFHRATLQKNMYKKQKVCRIGSSAVKQGDDVRPVPSSTFGSGKNKRVTCAGQGALCVDAKWWKSTKQESISLGTTIQFDSEK
jgi:hypothetical protein